MPVRPPLATREVPDMADATALDDTAPIFTDAHEAALRLAAAAAVAGKADRLRALGGDPEAAVERLTGSAATFLAGAA